VFYRIATENPKWNRLAREDNTTHVGRHTCSHNYRNRRGHPPDGATSSLRHRDDCIVVSMVHTTRHPRTGYAALRLADAWLTGSH
jgi:hypothetical protein